MNHKFFLNPQITKSPDFFSLNHLKDFLWVCFFSIFSFVVLVFPLNFIFDNFFKEFYQNLSNISFRQIKDSFFYTVCFIPIVEELQFRLPIDFKFENIQISISVFISRFFISLQFVSSIKSEYEILNFLLFLVTWVIILFLIKKLTQNVIWNYKVSPIYSYYLFNFVFAILHLLNFGDLNLNNFAIYFLFVLIHFIDGCLIGYLRCKYGFGSGLIFHGIKNLIAFI